MKQLLLESRGDWKFVKYENFNIFRFTICNKARGRITWEIIASVAQIRELIRSFVQTFLPDCSYFILWKSFSVFPLLYYLYSPLSPSPSPIPTLWRVSHVVRRNVVFERIKLLVKINFDRLHKLLLCLKISRLENNAALDGVCVVLYSVDIEKGGEKGGEKKKEKGARRLARFNVWLPRLFSDIMCGVSASTRSSFRSLYKLCNLYSAARDAASSTIPSENFFHYTVRIRGKGEKSF